LILRFLLLVTLVSTSINTYAAERFLVSFEFIINGKVVERGKPIVSQEKRTWQKGLQRNFLKLDCSEKETGEIKKLYSTVDFFTGLRVTHQLVGNNIELNVVRIVAQPRLVEIRALPSGVCKELAPIITTTTQTYRYPAEHNFDETRPFDENITFRARIQSIGGTR
jgi:hypothetical protein